MANYRSYRKVRSDQLTAGTIGINKLVSGVTPDYCVKMDILVIAHLAVVVCGLYHLE
jgi:hypothetical protein